MDKEALKKTISRRLKTALFEAGMSCCALSRTTGISATQIYCITRAQSIPGAETLMMIADTLGCSMDWLMGRTDCKEVHPDAPELKK